MIALTTIMLISLCGSIIFILTTAPSSYTLFFLFLLMAATITLTLLGKVVTFKIHFKMGIKLHVFLIFACIALLILQLSDNHTELTSAILYVIAFIITPGYSLSKILRFNPRSCIDFLSLAYAMSIALLAILGAFILILPSNLRGIFALSFVIFISLVSIYGVRKDKIIDVGQASEFRISNPAFILLAILLTFVCFFIVLYPLISKIFAFDISRNFLIALGSTKDVMGSFYNPPDAQYPLFNLYQSYLIYIVRPSVGLFQTVSVSLNLLTILTFYTMAKQYLKKYGGYLPALATLIWSLFGGFGWLNFLSLKTDNLSASSISLIQQADIFSYGDVTWRRLFFPLSMETSLVLVFAVLYLLKRNDLSRTNQIFFMTVLLTPLPLMHPYAVYFLLPFLICLAIFRPPEMKKQLKNIIWSLTISAFASLSLNYILSTQIETISIGYVPFIGYLLTALFMLAVSPVYELFSNKFTFYSKKVFSSKYLFTAVIAVLTLYFASLLLWFTGNLTFNFESLNRFGYIPILLYPAKLGITGILATITVLIFVRNPEYRSKELGAMLVSVLLLILGTIVIAILQTNYASTFTFNPNSWLSETIRRNILSFRAERMFELFKIPLALIASIAIGKYLVVKIKQKSKLSNFLLVSGLVSLILISGMASTYLGLQYYDNVTQTNSLTESELDVLNSLQNNIYADGKAIITSPQTSARSLLDFTGATAIVTESSAAWESKSPELPLLISRYSKTTPTYIYLNKIYDYQKIVDYPGTYLEHLSNVAPTSLENQLVQVKSINNWSIPTSQSSTALIIPFDESSMAISQPLYPEIDKQHTLLALSFKEDMQYMNSYQEPIDFNNVDINGTALFNGVDSFIRVNGTQINCDRLSVDFEFQPLDLTKNQVILSKFDWGTPSNKSWEVAQYGKTIVFKISPDGESEEVLQTPGLLSLDSWYSIKCEYDGSTLTIYVNGDKIASKAYGNGVFKSNTDVVIGAELKTNDPVAFAKMNLKCVQVLSAIPQMSEPIFTAYDVLSSTGLNYTAILSNANTVNGYKTYVLPYDDLITQGILAELWNSKQTVQPNFVVILNTDGYGPLLNLFGNVSSNAFLSNTILTDNSLNMQSPVEVPRISLMNNVIVLAQYANDGSSSPLVMMNTQGNSTIVYVNVYPLLLHNHLFDPSVVKALIETLTNFIDTYDDSTITPWISEPGLLFTKLQANGTVTTLSNSILSIEFPENQSLNLNDYDSVIVDSDEITVQRGYGFYTTLITSDPSITLIGNQTASVTINGSVTFVLRQPEISINGTIRFENFFMLHPSTIITDGRTTILNGDVTLKIYGSDEFTVAVPYKFNSPITVKYETPLMEFDELASLEALIPYVVLLGIFAILIFFIQQSKLDKFKDHK